MNLMSRKCLLNQATCSPKTFDDVHAQILREIQGFLFCSKRPETIVLLTPMEL